MIKKSRFISLVLAFIMIFSCFNVAFGVQFPLEPVEKVQALDMNAKVNVIIELESKPLLDYSLASRSALSAKSFLQTETAKAAKAEIVSVQELVQEEIIDTINSNANFKYSYTNTLNGFAAEIQRKDISKIKAIPEVKNVYLDEVYELPTPKMSTSNDMINTPKAWNTGYDGEGQVVAVIDTGVDVNHELMVLSDSANVKIVSDDITNVIDELNAKSLNSDLSAEDVYYNEKFPYCFDYADKDSDAFADNSDHGVHVAGTIAANGEAAEANGVDLNTDIIFNGVAPEAQIIGMKVFSSYASTAYTSDTLAAVEDSITLGADALNLSLGSTAGFTFYEGDELKIYEYEYSFERARDAGIIVAVAAGNEDRVYSQSFLAQAYGLNYSTTANVDSGLVGSPATKYHSTSVASIENTKLIAEYIQGPDDLKIMFSDTSASYIPSGRSFVEILNGNTYEYVDCGKGLNSDFEGLDLTDKIALMQRGETSFFEKVNNAAAAGSVGCIIYNNQAGSLNLNLTGVTENVPAICISQTDGQALLEATTKQITVDVSFKASFANDSNYQMSSFTSWGTTPDLRIKPEITAPGGQIYSTLPNDEYGMMSGTSMATPHVAGAAAIMQQYVDDDPKFNGMPDDQKADVIEAILMSTARVANDPETNNPYSPRRQGAGLMDLEAAVETDVYLINQDSDKAKVELFDEIGDSFDITFDIVNLSDEAYEYELTGSIFTENYEILSDGFYLTISEALHLEDSEMLVDGVRINPIGVPVTTGSAITGSAITGSAIVSAAPNATTSVTVSVELDSAEIDTLSSVFTNGFFVEGFVELLSTGEHPDLSIPYMGFYGDWRVAPAMDGSYYYDSSLSDFYYTNSYAYDYAYDEEGNPYAYNLLGSNFDFDAFDYSWISFSPNGDGYLDAMGYRLNLLRNVKQLKVDIYDTEDNLVESLLDDVYYTKTFVNSSGYLTTDDLPLWDGTNTEGVLMPDGQYKYVITALLDYSGAEPQVKEIPVILDTEAPIVVSQRQSGENTIQIEVEDNGYISYAILVDSVSGVEIENALDTPVKNNTFEFDYSTISSNNALLVIGDTAGNEYENIIEINHVYIGGDIGGGDSGNTGGTDSTEIPSDEPVTATVPESMIDINIDNGHAEISIDKDATSIIKDGKTDVLDISVDEVSNAESIAIAIPTDVTKLLAENNMKVECSYGDTIKFVITVENEGELVINYKADDSINNGTYLSTDLNFDINISNNGKDIDNTNNLVKIEINAKDVKDLSKAGIYTIDSEGNIEYVMTYLNGDVISFYPPHFSPYSVMVYDKTFNDIKGHWAQKFIEDMASKQIVNGKTDEIFAPDDTITRAEFITMVVRALALKGEGKSKITNIDDSKWYANYISLAKDAGLIEGSTYNAEGIISRVEMAKIISKAHAILNGTYIEFDGEIKFTDVSVDSDDAKYIGYANENGLINGFPGDLFMPVENTTRAQAIKVIHKLVNK